MLRPRGWIYPDTFVCPRVSGVCVCVFFLEFSVAFNRATYVDRRLTPLKIWQRFDTLVHTTAIPARKQLGRTLLAQMHHKPRGQKEMNALLVAYNNRFVCPWRHTRPDTKNTKNARNTSLPAVLPMLHAGHTKVQQNQQNQVGPSSQAALQPRCRLEDHRRQKHS